MKAAILDEYDASWRQQMIQFVLGLITGMAVTIFAIALTSIGDDDE